MKKFFFSIVAAATLMSCSDNENIPTRFILSDKFTTSSQGWIGDFADYPTTDSVFYELSYSHAKLPAPLDTAKKALRISGNNHSDDLFMFLKKKITGLKPNQTYSAKFEVEFASTVPNGMMGVGGSPGESVYFGAGFSAIEPKKEVDNGYYRIKNVGKISQATDGKDMKVMGNVANGTDKNQYTLVKRTGTFTGKTDTNGQLWLIIGTDSGFEATTTLYYTGVNVEFIEMTNQ
ncbi:hypothetical protein [Flectobacillus longus]|uniref:hypothetical protein n=1 Tax=Flectobacillus longus TaxID=2984207 RepID=UPI0024B7DE2D|nr:hypothetical protein [Flectobacillus longus]MDI9880669.1 hypothetical protein [Flectobacillus longus]